MKTYTSIVKTYTIITEKNGRELSFDGTVEELTQKFAYTLEIGASWNKKVNRNPTTIRSLVSNLQKAYEAKEARCYQRTSVYLKK